MIPALSRKILRDSARRELFPAALVPVLFLAVLGRGAAQEWYRSNPAGMALERIASQTVALHQEWALLVDRSPRIAPPELIKPYYNSGYSRELRTLYERGKVKRMQWIFRDKAGTTRINASLPENLEPPKKEPAAEDGEIPPFVEVFSSARSLMEIHQHLAAGVYTTKFFYREDLLIRAETSLDKKPLWTDHYRYTRSYILRGVERDYHASETVLAAIQGHGSTPPAVQDVASSLDLRTPQPIAGFVSSKSPYDYSTMSDVLNEVYAVPAAKVLYGTDDKGKVISETRQDAEGNILAEIANEWAGDRLKTIRWSAGGESGRIEFSYSSGDRVLEEDYRDGVLERKVRKQGDEEIEEIYREGKPILRAVWKEGRKISEERLR
ncbi:MAG: hypothetical protein LBG84_03230 [Treponema sp.]|nr:hypothetical protein [Treponema sp.]